MMSNLPVSWSVLRWPVRIGAMEPVTTLARQTRQAKVENLQFSPAEPIAFEDNVDLVGYLFRGVVISALPIYLLSTTRLMPNQDTTPPGDSPGLF